MIDLGEDVADVEAGVITLRRELHRHPELAFEEFWTARTLARHLRDAGLAVQDGIAGTGVLAVLDGSRPGRTLLVRADIDALPIPDRTGGEYASAFDGRSHACGHDAHAAILVGVARVLSRHRERLAGRVAFILQPADEPMRGARRMIDAGLFEAIRPDASLALHVLPMAHAGQAVVQRGPIWASRDELTLTLNAPPRGDAVFPAVDLARTAARLVTRLYELFDDEGRSPEPVTFRVRALSAEQDGPVWLGGSHTAPGTALIDVNLALYDNALRAKLLGRIAEVSGAVAAGAGATLGVRVDYALPALVNDEEVTSAVERAAERVIGRANIVTSWRNPFSDDFGLFMATAPGCLLLLGTANPAKGITEIWHRPGFDIDEEALRLGVHIMSLAALDVLR